MSMRSEIRALVDEANRAGKPISARIIWGLLTRDVPQYALENLLSSMCGSHQLVKVEAKTPQGKAAPSFYSPGPVPVHESNRREQIMKSMGFMEMKRLREARADAQSWAKARRRAA